MFNLILYFAFLCGQWTGSWDFYISLIQQGATCYVVVEGETTPPCFYLLDEKVEKKVNGPQSRKPIR